MIIFVTIRTIFDIFDNNNHTIQSDTMHAEYNWIKTCNKIYLIIFTQYKLETVYDLL
jgi:hypothetical protein